FIAVWIAVSHACAAFSFQRSGAPRDLHSFPTRRSSDLGADPDRLAEGSDGGGGGHPLHRHVGGPQATAGARPRSRLAGREIRGRDRKSTRLNSSHVKISYAVFCLKKKKTKKTYTREQ